MYFRKIIGKKVYLSPINCDDCLKYVEWLNNFEIAKGINAYSKVNSIASEKEWLMNNCNNRNYSFAIIDSESNMLIGNIGLMNIKEIDRTAELGIFIGDENYLSCGYGSEAIMILLEYAFNHLNLNNIMLKVYDFNKRAIKAYEKCGFKKFGEWKKSHYFNGKYISEIYMNILKDDFIKKD